MLFIQCSYISQTLAYQNKFHKSIKMDKYCVKDKYGQKCVIDTNITDEILTCSETHTRIVHIHNICTEMRAMEAVPVIFYFKHAKLYGLRRIALFLKPEQAIHTKLIYTTQVKVNVFTNMEDEYHENLTSLMKITF